MELVNILNLLYSFYNFKDILNQNGYDFSVGLHW